jgi:hypothetical protein
MAAKGSAHRADLCRQCDRAAILVSIQSTTSDLTNATRASPRITATGKRPSDRNRFIEVLLKLVICTVSLRLMRRETTLGELIIVQIQIRLSPTGIAALLRKLKMDRGRYQNAT